MAENSAIQWLTRGDVHGHTFNPWISCAHALYVGYDGKQHVHPGCISCYAESLMDTRYGKCQWGSNGNRVKTTGAYWRKALKWNRDAERDGVRVPVFPSLCDPFEEWIGDIVDSRGDVMMTDRPTVLSGLRPITMSDVRRELFSGTIDQTPNLDWILFTKRPGNVLGMWPMTPGIPSTCVRNGEYEWERTTQLMFRPNVHLYYSPANQETLDYGVPLLLRCRDLVPVLGLSIEPLLGRIDLRLDDCCTPDDHYDLGERIDHVIVGCESNGPRVGRLGIPARSGPGSELHEIETESEWWDACAQIVRQCRSAGVPCFVKQGPRDGRVVHQLEDFPADCRVREFPEPA